MLEQELDAVRTLAKKEADAKRLAPDDDDGSNSEGPRKRARRSSVSSLYNKDPDIERITMLWEWEKQRAERALEQVEFLEAECQLKLCSAGQELRSRSRQRSTPRKRASMFSDAGDSMILSESRRVSAESSKPLSGRSKTDLLKGSKESRRSTIFLPEEGIFRTVSQDEADAVAAKSAGSSSVPPAESAASLPITPTESDPNFRRTPSVDPPDLAVLNKERISLLSLLEAPHREESPPVFNIPTMPGPVPETRRQESTEEETEAAAVPSSKTSEITLGPRQFADSIDAPRSEPLPSRDVEDKPTVVPRVRPHTTTSYYPTTAKTTTVTTTKVPLRPEPTAEDGPTLAQRLLKAQRTPARQTGRGSGDDGFDPDRPSFDVTDPALTPTMTREQALAQIRERRDRARSVGRVGSGGSSASNTSRGSGGGTTMMSSSSSSSSSSASSASTTRTSTSQADVRKKVSGSAGPAAVRRPGSSFERGREPSRREGSGSSATSGAVRGTTGAGVRRMRS